MKISTRTITIITISQSIVPKLGEPELGVGEADVVEIGVAEVVVLGEEDVVGLTEGEVPELPDITFTDIAGVDEGKNFASAKIVN